MSVARARLGYLAPAPHDHQPWTWLPRHLAWAALIILPGSTLLWFALGREDGLLGLAVGLIAILIFILPASAGQRAGIHASMGAAHRMGKAADEATVELHRHWLRIHAATASLTFARARVTVALDGATWRVGNAVCVVTIEDAWLTLGQRRRLQAWGDGVAGPLVSWW